MTGAAQREQTMDKTPPSVMRPIAEPQVIEGAYSEDQHRRMLDVVRNNGPFKLILAQHFNSAEELIATVSGGLPEGVEPTLDMFLSPVFRGYFSDFGVCLYPEIQDCFHNARFIELARNYWNADYAEPESMLFNLQGPCSGGGAPHVDATCFRGITSENAPIWLMNTMSKSGLFKRWQAKKAQVIAWYYRGTIGGGFTYWPEGPHEQPRQIHAPMWGRAVVVENEMMYHTAESCGPAALRNPTGLSMESLIEPDPDTRGGWRITDAGRILQAIPEQEFRFLVHWGGIVYKDYAELKVSKDHSDDLSQQQVIDIFMADLKQRGMAFAEPADPLTDKAFINRLTTVYDPGLPLYFPPEPEEALACTQ